MPTIHRFIERVNGIDNPSILELGTRRWNGNPSTHNKEHFPGSRYTMTDFIDGDDVDVVSDVHDLKEFGPGTFDAVLSYSVFEHIQFPWIAAQAIHRVLKPGGLVYAKTHQTFPVHGYPNDYTRWTDNGLRSLFEWAGFEVLDAEMAEPCVIQRPEGYPVWDYNAPAYIAVAVFCAKGAH